MASLLILKTGSTYPTIRQTFGDFEDWFLRHLEGAANLVVRDVTRERPPDSVTDWLGVVVTGSPAMVTEQAAWSEQTAAWLREAIGQGVPVLGVCYGHQLLAHAFGGRVGFREQGRESGTFQIGLNTDGERDPLLGQLPAEFSAHLTHAQSVLELPTEASLLARSDGEPHQAFRIGQHAWGVQFHPEFDERIMKGYLETQARDLEGEGQDPVALLANVRQTPQATSLLRRFADYACSRDSA
ncbi:glutamine amidotransferase [Marinobacter sp. LN3S78]|uniref:glutamine amidotransferase n=1 Tax=Marinobacter sp. LN3S78 TaxID=3382300 RepID=UPI00387A963C